MVSHNFSTFIGFELLRSRVEPESPAHLSSKEFPNSQQIIWLRDQNTADERWSPGRRWCYRLHVYQGLLDSKMPSGPISTGEKVFYCHIKNELLAVTFVSQIFRNFAWNDEENSYFLHCGDELSVLVSSWMRLTYGNVIFDILEPPPFQRYSILPEANILVQTPRCLRGEWCFNGIWHKL